MAVQKKPEEKSTNAHTLKEHARRAKLTGFALKLDRSKRALKQAESDARKKIRTSLGFDMLSADEQALQLNAAVQAVNDKRRANNKHPEQLKPSPNESMLITDGLSDDNGEDLPTPDGFSHSDDNQSHDAMELDGEADIAEDEQQKTTREVAKAQYQNWMENLFVSSRKSWQQIRAHLKIKLDRLQETSRVEDIFKCLDVEELEDLAHEFNNEPARCPVDERASMSPLQFFSAPEFAFFRNQIALRDNAPSALPGPKGWWDACPAAEVHLMRQPLDKDLANEAYQLMFGNKVQARARYGRIEDFDLERLVMVPIGEQKTNSEGNLINESNIEALAAGWEASVEKEPNDIEDRDEGESEGVGSSEDDSNEEESDEEGVVQNLQVDDPSDVEEDGV